MNSTNDVKDSTFKSYIDESELENISLNDLRRTQLLDGETLVHESKRVLMYLPLSERKKAALGVLTVTTFKLSFVPFNKDEELGECYLSNNLLRKNEICLSSIDMIYQIGDKSKKKLTPGQSLSGKVKEILIICKNMRVLSFSFKHAEKDHGRIIANTLLHHAFPTRHQLLFAYDFKEPYYKPIMKEARLYTTAVDWRKELERLKCVNWRVSDVNEDYQTSQHFPEFLVVPQSVSNASISTASRHFRNGGFPVWVWGTETSALVRMPDLLASITDRTQESFLIAHVHKSHPQKRQPVIIDLGKDFSTPKDVQNSFNKLRNLCLPLSIRLFKEQDFKFYGHLDNTKWFHHISACLSKAVECAKMISDGTTVVLQEDKNQDLNCVVSSLIQIILDPFWRTRKGFQSLVQKEWVALGHPFAYRLGHIINYDIEPSFVFLLFLDCVWQLLQQYPIAFQFTETYLTTIWDSSHITIFDTFLFNCEHDRLMATAGINPLIIRSVWDWSEQFNEDHIVLFNNPLYDKNFKEKLEPRVGISSLELWKQCYFRWLPNLEIRNGGKPQIDLCNRFLAEEVDLLKHKLKHGESNGAINKTKENLHILKKINSFYPFSFSSDHISGALHLSNDLLSSDALETQSILNLTND